MRNVSFQELNRRESPSILWGTQAWILLWAYQSYMMGFGGMGFEFV